MTALVLQRAPIVFTSSPRPSPVRRIAFVGQGDVMQKKIWRALQVAGFDLEGIAVSSLETQSHLAGLPHSYFQIDRDGWLPLDELDDSGFLKDTLWVIATPSPYHVQYAIQLAGFGRVAIEKPLAADSYQAKRLRPFAKGLEIYPIDHKLFNASPLALIDKIRQDRSALAEVSRIEGTFFERDGFASGRQADDVIADMQYHLFVPIVAAFKAAGSGFEMTVDRAVVSQHEADPQGRFQIPTMWTASRLTGVVRAGGREMTYDFRQAKGAPANDKVIRFLNGRDEVVVEMDLNESGYAAHGRLLEALMQPRVDMRHSLEDAIAVMELIDASRQLARYESPYGFGSLPHFLQ